ETMLVLDLDRAQARARVRALGWGLTLSAVASFFRDFHWKAVLFGKERQLLPFIPAELPFGAHGAALRMGTEVSLLSLGAGVLVGLRVILLAAALCVVQHYSLDFPVWLTLASLVLSVVLMLVGTRVLGETNWAPISALANLMQAVFAALAPGSMRINMIGSGMSGTVAAHGEHLMQDYKAGKIVGANNRHLTIVQLMAVPVGSAAVAIAYPALRDQY